MQDRYCCLSNPISRPFSDVSPLPQYIISLVVVLSLIPPTNREYEWQQKGYTQSISNRHLLCIYAIFTIQRVQIEIVKFRSDRAGVPIFPIAGQEQNPFFLFDYLKYAQSHSIVYYLPMIRCIQMILAERCPIGGHNRT